ncbi:MAG: hypothetical protein V7641_2832 [Blastocatellia bacterium]
MIDYLDGKLKPVEAARVAAHLASDCAACGETRAWYDRVRTVAASDDTVAPPAWVFKQAVRIFDTARRPRLTERIGQAIATLVFDSFARPQLAGIRSTETTNRQLLYRAGDYAIDLQIAPSTGARVDLIGQVLREGEATFESVANLPLEIARGNQLFYATVTDEMGEFKISDVDYGTYDLRIDLADGQITLPELPITQI